MMGGGRDEDFRRSVILLTVQGIQSNLKGDSGGLPVRPHQLFWSWCLQGAYLWVKNCKNVMQRGRGEELRIYNWTNIN